MVRKGVLKLVLTSFLLVLTVAWSGVQAREWAASSAIDTTVALNQLPPQGIEVYRLIHRGGPFPFAKDGTVFGNRERLLPGEKRGYYREYTVKTPQSVDRGARRIVCGGPAVTPDACFYTADHYASFRKIVP
jgi:ribonuclease T1